MRWGVLLRYGRSTNLPHLGHGRYPCRLLTCLASLMRLRAVPRITWRRYVANPTSVYWDSNTYLDYIRGNHSRHQFMQLLIDDWKQGKVTMVTSALTIAEVLWWRTSQNPTRLRITRAEETRIRELFNPPKTQKLTIVEVSRRTAEAARELVWKSAVKPKDAIHVASAIEARCPVLQTSDEELMALSGKVGGNPLLVITYPDWTRQGEMTAILDQAARPSGSRRTNPASRT